MKPGNDRVLGQETLEARTNLNGMRIVKDGKDYQGLQITNLKKLAYFFKIRKPLAF